MNNLSHGTIKYGLVWFRSFCCALRVVINNTYGK
jgi:hypothetical protein